MWCNSNSYSVAADTAAAENPVVRSLPWPLRVLVPGFEGGWPA
jgi:hypothetical protein